MKKALLISVLILSVSILKAATAGNSDIEYDMLVNDIIKASGSKGTALLYNPQNMGILYIYNSKLAIGEAWEPGSIIKIATSIVYLNDNPSLKYKTSGYYMVYPGDLGRPRRKISSRHVRIRRGDFFPDGKMCPRGKVELSAALAYSSNSYFLAMSKKINFVKWHDFLKNSGFGDKTGYNLGLSDIIEDRGEVIFKSRFNRLMSLIGLGPHFEITAIQYASFFASLFNGGKILKPVKGNDEQVLKYKYDFPQGMELVYKGLKECVLSGTGKGFLVPSALEVYAKTGSTMQHKKPWKPNGWFSGVVKLKSGKMIGVLVFVKNNTSRSAKYIAASLLRRYIRNNNL
jgi:cell division protein FtsI/penicillin-binding protein 2